MRRMLCFLLVATCNIAWMPPPPWQDPNFFARKSEVSPRKARKPNIRTCLSTGRFRFSSDLKSVELETRCLEIDGANGGITVVKDGYIVYPQASTKGLYRLPTELAYIGRKKTDKGVNVYLLYKEGKEGKMRPLRLEPLKGSFTYSFRELVDSDKVDLPPSKEEEVKQ